jgi:hypothetical protein
MRDKAYYFRVHKGKNNNTKVKAFSIFQVISEFLNISLADYVKQVKTKELKVTKAKTLSGKIDVDLTSGFKIKNLNRRSFVTRKKITEIPLSITANIDFECPHLKAEVIGSVKLYRCVSQSIIEQFNNKSLSDALLMNCCRVNLLVQKT